MKVKIWSDWTFNSTKIAFYDKREDGMYVYNLYDRSVIRIDEDKPVPEEFVLKIPYGLSDEVFIALAEALDERNIKTDKDAKIQGTLEATRYHLEDLRSLLKLHKQP